MSRAIAVFHGQFGRATLYQLNRPFNVHAHREGHLIFHVGGADGRVDVDGKGCPLTGETVVAVSPWEPHNFIPSDADAGALFFVLYVNSDWFATGGGEARLRFGRSLIARTSSLDRRVRRAAGMVCASERLGELDGELRSLIEECSDASWRAPDGRPERRALDGAIDFRVRKSIRLMQNQAGADIVLDAVARESRTLPAALLQALPHPDRPDAERLSQHHSDGARPRQARAQRGAGGGDRIRSRLLIAERIHQVLLRQCRNGADRLSASRSGDLAADGGAK